MVGGLFKRQKSLVEMEEETERLEAENEVAGQELSLAQKRAAAAQLKKRGLDKTHFQGWSWRQVWNWLKTH